MVRSVLGAKRGTNWKKKGTLTFKNCRCWRDRGYKRSYFIVHMYEVLKNKENFKKLMHYLYLEL